MVKRKGVRLGFSCLFLARDGNLLTTQDPDGNVTAYTYDGDGDVLSVTTGYGTPQAAVTRYTYDDDGDVLTVTDPDGNIAAYTYDDLGDVLSTTTGVNTALAATTQNSYNGDGELVSTTNPAGEVTNYTYNDLGDVLTATTAAGTSLAATTTNTYDGDGNLLITTDPDSDVTDYGYNASGELVSTITAAGTSLAATTSATYNGDGEVASSTDADGNVADYTYDANGDVLSVTTAANTPNAATTTYTYDGDGNVLTMTDPDGNVTKYTYDDNGDVLTQTTAYGTPQAAKTTYTYDDDGDVLTMTDPDGNVTTYTYDANGDVLTTTTASGTSLAATTTDTYDANGNELTSTNADGTTTYTYNADGEEASVTDPAGNTTTYTYNGEGQVASATNQLGQTTDYTYNLAGELSGTLEPDGQAIFNTYDGDGNLTQADWYNADGTLQNTLTYTYNAAGQLASASSNAGTYTYTYDGDGNLTQVQEPYGLSVSYQYDADGNVTQETGALNGVTTGVTTYTYDKDGNLTSELYQGQGATALLEQQWNDQDELAQATRYSDAAGTQLVGTTSYSYDEDGNVTQIEDTDPSGNVIENFQYTYDSQGWVSSQTINGTTTNYSYDSTGELLQAGSSTYSYDANGNRTMSGYVVGADNLLQSDGTWTYTYNANDDLATKTDPSTGITWTYQYDAANQMTSAVETDSSGDTLESVYYTYDVYGNVLQEVTTTGSTTTTQRFGYDNSNAWVELDGNNNLVDQRVFDNASNLVATVSAAGSTSWMLADNQGSISAVTDATGAVTESTTYDAYGNASNPSALAASDGYGYAGYVYSAVTGLYEAGLRWYNPQTGNWTEPDPIGFNGGSLNLNEYVGNDPVNATDPTGQYLVVPSSQQDKWVSYLSSQFGVNASTVNLPSSGVFNSVFGTSLSGVEVGPADKQKLQQVLDNTPQDQGNLRNFLSSLVLGPGYNLEAQWDDNNWDLSPISLTDGQMYELTQLRAQLDDGGNYTRNANNTGPSYVGAAGEGLVIGGKAIVNGSASAVTSTVTLGYVDKVELLEVTEMDRQYGYDTAAAFAKGGATILIGVGTGGLAQGAGAGGVAGTIGKAALIYDTASNGVNVGRGLADMLENGITLNNVIQVGAGALGLAGNLSAARNIVQPEATAALTGCFGAGTPLLTPDGHKAIERFRVGDRILARNENYASAGVEVRVVEEIFQNTAQIWHLHVGGQVIRTTGEHPFWVRGKGWVAAEELQIGDELSSHDGQWVPVEDLLDAGEYETVYNLRVGNDHTYFVGERGWGFSVWAHNACVSRINENPGLVRQAEAAGKSAQASIDRLTTQLGNGNFNPGIGTRGVFGNVLEARARDGARVYFRRLPNGDAEILAKSTKASQDAVIGILKGLYGG